LDILKKFGWSGGGLGRNQDGITKPVEAVFKQSLGQEKGLLHKKLRTQKKTHQKEENLEEEDEEETV
jgi:G-patch domain